MISKYDAFEVHPVQAFDSNGRIVTITNHKTVPVAFLEQCEDGDSDIFSWSVYGHLPEEWSSESDETGPHLIQCGVECLADCPTKEIALDIANALTAIAWAGRINENI